MAKLNNFFALDISSNSLVAIECQRNFWGKFIINNINRLELDPGVIVNGEIKNPNALYKAIKKLFSTAKPGKIDCKYCLLSIPENKVFTHIFQAPADLKHDQIEDFIFNQVEGIIPFNRETTIADFKIVKLNDKFKQILYAAAPQKLINDILAILKKFNVSVLAVELESLSVARALLTKQTSKEANIIVDIGGNFSNITIFDKEGLKLTVSLPIAGNQMTEELCQRAKLTKAKANELKAKEGLNTTKKLALQALQDSLDKIVEEMRRSIVFYQERSGRSVAKAIFVGGSANMPGLIDYFQSKLDLVTVKGNPWHRLRKSAAVLKRFPKQVGPLYTSAIGLILRGSGKNYRQGINMLPAKNKKSNFINIKPSTKQDWPKFIILGLIIVALVLLFVFQDKLRSGRIPLTVTSNQLVQTVDLVVSYAEGDLPNLQNSRITGSLVDAIGEAEVVLEKTTTQDIKSLADDYVTVINESTSSITLVAGSRLSDGSETYYLLEALSVPAGSRELAQLVDQVGDFIKLNTGRYDFVALAADRRAEIYADKVDRIKILDPELAGKFDTLELASAQEDLQQQARQMAWIGLAEGYYVNEPVEVKLLSIEYISNEDGNLVVLGQVEYYWLKIPANELIVLTLDRLNDSKITQANLQSAQVELVPVNINNLEKFVQIQAIWRIDY